MHIATRVYIATICW